MTDARTALEWDVRSWTPALELWDDVMLKARERNRHIASDTLELGARGGGLSLWLSQRAERVVCSDVTGSDLEDAVVLHERAGARNIYYRSLDARNLPYRLACDVIVFRAVAGALTTKADQQRMFTSILGALKPGGILLFAEHLPGTSLHARLRRRNTWNSNWRYPTVTELREYMSGFNYGEIRTTGVLAGLGRTERQRDWLARLDQAVLNRLVPSRKRTIAYGWAMK